MNYYIRDLFDAFCTVDKRYYFAEVFRDIERFYQGQEAVIQSTENSFSAELFHHWRNIMSRVDKSDAYNDLAIDFDVRKDWFDREIIENGTLSYRPDLVLHLSQVDWDPDFQKVYVEVKTNPNPFVKDDIQKLINAIVRLRFESGVFISVNSNFTNLLKLMKNIILAEDRRLSKFNIDWDSLYLFHSTLDSAQSKIISQPISFRDIIK